MCSNRFVKCFSVPVLCCCLFLCFGFLFLCFGFCGSLAVCLLCCCEFGGVLLLQLSGDGCMIWVVVAPLTFLVVVHCSGDGSGCAGLLLRQLFRCCLVFVGFV
ncbi:hypothetical protein QL285_031774 [Trifolium repens]|nr:hypothetical protein QL285_031774 [Trifolium repens]